MKKYHYLTVDSRLKLWNHLTLEHPLSPEEALNMMKNGAYDIIEITNPAEPRSLALHQEN
jgi:hypothetical protein